MNASSLESLRQANAEAHAGEERKWALRQLQNAVSMLFIP